MQLSLSIPEFSLISIVPHLSPRIDGIGDYALTLARNIQSQSSIETKFVVGNREPQSHRMIDGFAVESVKYRHSSSLIPILERCDPKKNIILFHYAARAYGYKGCPLWILNALKKYKKRGGKVAIMFHEIYAQGAHFSRSDFWMAPAQKQVVKAFVRMADQCFTNCEDYAARLMSLEAELMSKLIVLPVISTTGEPDFSSNLDQRDRKLVVFGQGGNKANAYKYPDLIRRACQVLRLENIIDVGPGEDIPAEIQGLPITRLGKLKSEEISEILKNSVAGLLAYQHERLGKSSIFASYCAHGMLPINVLPQANLNSLNHDHAFRWPLYPDVHYWDVGGKESDHLSMTDLQEIALNANCWYATHSVAKQSAIFVEKLSHLFKTPCLLKV